MPENQSQLSDHDECDCSERLDSLPCFECYDNYE